MKIQIINGLLNWSAHFSFDKDNDDWTCDEVFTTRDQPFVIECESDWELVETFFISLVNEYLSFWKICWKIKRISSNRHWIC